MSTDKTSDWETLKGALGPIVFQMALDNENIKDLFYLVKQLFHIFDIDHIGILPKSRIALLKDLEVIDAQAVSDLQDFKTVDKEGLSFKEFTVFFGSCHHC